MGRSRQAAVCAAHIVDARRRRDAQYAAGTLHLVAFEALDFERGEVCGRHRSDAAKAQSGAVRGVERLETAVDFAQSVDLEKKDEVQDDAVGCDGTGDRIDRHGAKGVRYLRCHGGAAAFQRCFDQPAKRKALRRRRGLSVVGDLRLEPGNGFLPGDIGEHSLDIPGNGHLQLRAAFQLGEGRVEQGASPLEELAYALLVGHPRAELYGQNRRRSHELLDHLLMGDEQVAQIFAAAAFQVRAGTAADDRGIRSGHDRAEAVGDGVRAGGRVLAVRPGRDDGVEIERVSFTAFDCPGAHPNCSWPRAINVSNRSRRSCSTRFCSAMLRACDDRAGSLSHQLMPIAMAFSTDAISSRSRMLRSSTPTRQIVMSPAITTPLSRMRSRMSASVAPWTECSIRPFDMTFSDSLGAGSKRWSDDLLRHEGGLFA